MNRYVYMLSLIVITSYKNGQARMSGAGAGVLGGGLGFLAGTMVASSVARNNRSYSAEPQVIYTTVDKRPIETTVVNHHHHYSSDSEDSYSDETDGEYEYKVVKVKKNQTRVKYTKRA